MDKLTNEERRARALSIDQIAEKIKNEYGDALAALGMIPVVARVWDYSVEEHVEFARQRGVTLDPDAQRIRREYLELLRSASRHELNVTVRLLNLMLEYSRTSNVSYVDMLNEVISMLVFAEGMKEWKEERAEG